MRRCFSIAILVFALTGVIAAFAGQGENARYADCTRNAARAPEETYKRARAWYGQEGSLAAQHCMALALYELKQYGDAAETLDGILRHLTQGHGRLWLNMKAQAAKAHRAAGDYDAAEGHLSDALLWAVDKDMDKAMVPLLVERAGIYDTRKQHLKAVQDLDHALEISPSTAIRLQRGRIFLKMGMKQPAREDAEFILKTEPENEAARGLLAQAWE